MDNKEFKRFKKSLNHTVKVYEKMKNGSFINDKKLMAELMDDSKLTGGGCPKQKPRIGENYQVDMIKLGLTKKNHKYNLRMRK